MILFSEKKSFLSFFSYLCILNCVGRNNDLRIITY